MFRSFLVEIPCFTDEEIEAQGLRELSDLFDGTYQKKQSRKKIQYLPIFDLVHFISHHTTITDYTSLVYFQLRSLKNGLINKLVKI